VTVFFHPVLADFQKKTAFLNVPRLRFFVDKDEYGALVE
jgi:hypothetical protein